MGLNMVVEQGRVKSEWPGRQGMYGSCDGLAGLWLTSITWCHQSGFSRSCGAAWLWPFFSGPLLLTDLPLSTINNCVNGEKRQIKNKLYI